MNRAGKGEGDLACAKLERFCPYPNAHLKACGRTWSLTQVAGCIHPDEAENTGIYTVMMSQSMTLEAQTTRVAPRSKIGTDRSKQPLLLALFFLTIVLPIQPSLGGFRLDPERLFLMVCFLPFSIQLFSGGAGRFTFVDGGVLGFASLILFTLLYHHGTSQLPFALSQVLEFYGAYLAGRMLVRGPVEYRRFVRFFVAVLLIMLPLAVYELFSSRMLLPELLGHFFPVASKNMAFRFGLSRVQVVFPHSILYGLFCSLAFGSVYFVYRAQVLKRATFLGLVFVMTFMSLSSGPMLSIALQMGLIVWDKLTRGSWKLLGSISAFIYLFLTLFSHRGPIKLFFEYFTLDPQTAWTRLIIWDWGKLNVMQHPFLGIGLADWARPSWLPSSVDNFWLLIAMRYGLPCFALLALATLTHISFIMRTKNLSAQAQELRKGYLISLVGLVFVLMAVDVWGEVAVFVFFFLGAGAFFYTSSLEMTEKPSEGFGGKQPASARGALPFSRFPQTTGRGPSRAEMFSRGRPKMVNP